MKAKTDVIDLNLVLFCGHLTVTRQKGVTCEYLQDDFLANHGFFTAV